MTISSDSIVTIRAHSGDLIRLERAANAAGFYLKRHPTAVPGFFVLAEIPSVLRPHLADRLSISQLEDLSA